MSEKNKKRVMSDSIKGAIIGALITTLGSVLIFFLGNFSTQATLEQKTVETLSEYFDYVDKDMSYKSALQALYNESKEMDSLINQKNMEIKDLQQKNDNLSKQISSTPNTEMRNPTFISDGVKIQDAVNNAVIILDNKYYYSEAFLDLALMDNELTYEPDKNTVFYSTDGKKITSETKIDLFSTSVLYDGVCYDKYLPSDGGSFSMGSNTYNKGFVIFDDHSLFGEGDGYALFDLKGEYSKISFDVGKTNEHEMQDVVLKVYLNNEYVEEYTLSSQSPPISLTIDLNYANSLKLEISGGSRVKYGFANVFLHY